MSLKNMAPFEDAVVSAKSNLPNVTPTPPGFHSVTNAHELKSRLQWGEPGLTIVDVRDHVSFNDYRIMGAINMPLDQLTDLSSGLLDRRDIYVYGASDAETANAANMLRQAGFSRVAELKGGLSDWKAIQGPIEGRETTGTPSAGAYNVASRLREFAEVKDRERSMK